jgi:hypothetical protein
MEWLYPIRTGRTFFDVWTIFHLAFWVFMGSNFWNARGYVDKSTALMLGLAASYMWEAFERYAECRWPKLWLSPESWYNSYLSDPMTCVIGILFAWYALENWRY